MLFKGLGGRLHVELTEPTVPIAPALLNQRALPEAQVKSLRLESYVFENGAFRPPTDEEYARVALREPEMQLRGAAGEPVTHRAPNGEYFTVRDVLRAVEETERATRARSDWSGGVDVHHVYFEGVHRQADGTWAIYWGS
ncbi:MAG TPA: hypothetical protein VFS00_04845 [Polyangiaceae bacterium]|nr:hypothetical protein [Polyangiaceae bacterium]